MDQPTTFIYNNARPPLKALLSIGGFAMILPPVVGIVSGSDLSFVAPLAIGTALVASLIFVLFSLEFWLEKRNVKAFFACPPWHYDDCGIWFGKEAVYDEVGGYTSISNMTTVAYNDHFLPPADYIGGFMAEGERKGPWIAFHQVVTAKNGKMVKDYYYPVAAGHEVDARELVVHYRNKAEQDITRTSALNLRTNVFIACFFVLLALPFVVDGGVGIVPKIRLMTNAIPTTGQVVSKYSRSGKYNNANLIVYIFQVPVLISPGNTNYQTTVSVGSDFYNVTSRDSKIPVVYDRYDPSLSRPTGINLSIELLKELGKIGAASSFVLLMLSYEPMFSRAARLRACIVQILLDMHHYRQRFEAYTINILGQQIWVLFYSLNRCIPIHFVDANGKCGVDPMALQEDCHFLDFTSDVL